MRDEREGIRKNTKEGEYVQSIAYECMEILQ
jgi:hypothetical protein